MRLFLLICSISISTISNAFDNECMFLLKSADKLGTLDKLLNDDSQIEYFQDSNEKPKSPIDCVNKITDYEKHVCSDESLIKLDQIAYSTMLQNAMNARKELLEKEFLHEWDQTNYWLQRQVADDESVCLKLMNLDQVKLKIRLKY